MAAEPERPGAVPAVLASRGVSRCVMRVGTSAALAVGLGFLLAGQAVQRAEAARARSVAVAATLDSTERGTRVARSFVGFSMEYKDAIVKTGNAATLVNPVFLGLVRGLDYGNGPPLLRIGGGSNDESWWNPERLARPRGIYFDLDRGWTDAIAEFVRQTGSPLILGLNFAQRDYTIASQMARELMANLPIGSIRTFEIGNEPDIYPIHPYGQDERGRTLYVRGKTYDFADYRREVRRFISVMRRLRPRPPLAGPAASCTPEWCGGLPLLLRQEGRRLNYVTYHTYPLHACRRKPGDRGYPTIQELLADGLLNRAFALKPAVQAARRYGLPVRLTETNSSACGGAQGVSDAFASALWSVDWMFVLAAIGVQGVDFHSSSPTYAPFYSLFRRDDRRFLGVVNPLYYGMRFFSEATANGARLLLGTTLGTRLSRPASMHVWATLDRRRTARIVVLNKESRQRGVARIRVPGARRPAELVRLEAPSLSAKEGVTLAGQSFPVPTMDGRIQGERVAVRVRPHRGVYRFTVPAASAALLKVDGVSRAHARRGSR